MKGIILAGGKGTRLEPLTSVFNKHLLPVYDKPMIYYPLSVLMLAGIRDILIITNENDTKFYDHLLGNGDDFGININYEVQKKADGIAQSFLIGKKFIGNENVCLILGDNMGSEQIVNEYIQPSYSDQVDIMVELNKIDSDEIYRSKMISGYEKLNDKLSTQPSENLSAVANSLLDSI